jgi:ketosteroid isomerase-like protein
MDDVDQISLSSVRAFNDRDIEAMLALAHPDITIELVGGFADLMGSRFEGLEGVRRFYTDWFATFGAMHVEIEETLRAGERLVLMTLLTATAAGTDQETALPGAIVLTARDGKLLRAGFYYNRDEALRDTGLAA